MSHSIICVIKRYNSRFLQSLTAQRTVTNTNAQVARVQLCANHMQHMERIIMCNMSCTICYEGTVQLLSSNTIYFKFILLAETINR